MSTDSSTATKRYRMYIDESGDHTYSQLDDPSQRYLGLTGIVVESSHYLSDVHPKLEELKAQHFLHHPDDPVILTRSKIRRKSGVFKVLRDRKLNAAWQSDFLGFIRNTRFMMFTAVIDKKEHIERYHGSAWHPYHYCLNVLLERYMGYLNAVGGRGDVLAESRGGVEDLLLKQVYEDTWNKGTWYHSG